MPNRTGEFSEACLSHASTSTSTTRSPAEAEALRKRRKSKRNAKLDRDSVDFRDPDTDVWALEASRISLSLQSLANFLASIRRAYLDVSSSSASRHYNKGKASPSSGFGRGELDLSKGLFEAWRDVKWLNDRERDEVDWQAKTVLRRSMERVRELEAAETSRRHASALNALQRKLFSQTDTIRQSKIPADCHLTL